MWGHTTLLVAYLEIQNRTPRALHGPNADGKAAPEYVLANLG